MADINNDEIITETFFWVRKIGPLYEANVMEYQALKLTNLAKVVLVEITTEKVDTKKNKDAKDGFIYNVTAQGTKQKLLLLKYMLEAWLQGAMFSPMSPKI